MESNGVLGSERSANTRDKLCALLMANTNYINDLPPRELPNPSPDTYASDLVSIQDLLLGGQVKLLEECKCRDVKQYRLQLRTISGHWQWYLPTSKEKMSSRKCVSSTATSCYHNKILSPSFFL